MLKRVLHAANQVVVHEETHTGIRELSIEGTVNDKSARIMVGNINLKKLGIDEMGTTRLFLYQESR